MVTRYLSLCNYLCLLGYSPRETSTTQLCYPEANSRIKTAKSPSKFHSTVHRKVENNFPVATLTSQYCLLPYYLAIIFLILNYLS